ncbi:MAG: acylphosphatase [Candidatus Omnitrophica bacterium]|nr:acylphosphatase [Candidatus Omnitrophota bacterium]
MKRIHVIYSGRVQGIGFRFTAERIALSLGITGWVKNLFGGEVEIVAEADEKKLEKFLKEINSHFSNYIQNQDLDWQEATGEFKDFAIRF